MQFEELKAERSSTVVLIEDDEEQACLMTRWLQEAGYAVLACPDGSEGLRTIARSRVDAVCLDINLPSIDGLAVLGALQANIAARDHLPILVLTSETAPEVRRRALGLGASDFLTKPCQRTELLLRLRNHLRLRYASLLMAEQNLLLDGLVRHQTALAEEALGQLVERLARAAEYRDDHTGAHALRVGALAGRLALTLGLSATEAARIESAARLHDVGKIGIPDAVLRKPGRFTPDEAAAMGAHTSIGAGILGGSRVPVLELAADIARTHHEWWNGQGPLGLAGEAIPLAGRIVCVADVFDALTTDRPYKRAWSLDEALAEMRSERGTRFDPAILAALERVVANESVSPTSTLELMEAPGNAATL